MATGPAPTETNETASSDLTPFKVFEMYVDGTKWLLAIIAGLLVFGNDMLKDRTGSGLDVWLFALAALLLLMAAGLALTYLFLSHSYASKRADPQVLTVTGESTYKTASIVYPIMLTVFGAGLILFATFVVANFARKIGSGKPIAIVAADDGRLVAQRGDCLWIREAADPRSSGWKSLRSPGKSKVRETDKC